MVTFSFFSPKGGVGKTTLTLLFAAYAAYYLKLRVLVVDFESTARIQDFRDKDNLQAIKPGSPLHNYMKTREVQRAYSILSLGAESYSENDLRVITRQINRIVAEDKYDLLVLDFSALYSPSKPEAWLFSNQLVDLVYIPHNTDIQERQEAFRLGTLLQKEGVPFRFLWYRLQDKLIKDPSKLIRVEEQMLQAYNMRYSAHRIRAFNKAMEAADIQCFVRNTLCWPDRYVKMCCPVLISLFDEILTDLKRL